MRDLWLIGLIGLVAFAGFCAGYLASARHTRSALLGRTDRPTSDK